MIGCNRIYDEHYSDFPEYQWTASHEVMFTPEIKDTTATYMLGVYFSHVYGFPFRTMGLRITTTAPSGKQSYKDYYFDVIGEGNDYISTCAGDYCDMETELEQGLLFSEAGTYTLSVQPLMPRNPVNGVMAVGIYLKSE